MITTPYGFGKETSLDFDTALARAREVLKANGFGILTEIDVRAAFREKLGVEFRPYRILGACNPPFAHQALSAEINLGLLLPCNVIVYENDQRRATVMAMDPAAAMQMTGNPAIGELAGKVKAILKKVIAEI